MKKIDVLFVLSLMSGLVLTSCKQDATSPPDTPASVAPSITKQPSNVTLMLGQTATFTVSATGTAPLSYQWQKNGVNVSGATSASYSLVVTASDSGKQFRCIVSNAKGSTTSNSAVLNAVAAAIPPVITEHPSSVVAFAGDTVTRYVVATGTGPLSYQWQKDGVNVSGATSANYTFVATYTDSGKTLRCVVVNSAGSVTSNPAVLNVTQLIEIGRPMNGGVICYIDGTAQHGLYFREFVWPHSKNWQGALDTASILGGFIPTVLQLQQILYPNKIMFDLDEYSYWSSEEVPVYTGNAWKVLFNSNNPQLNGQPAVTNKLAPGSFVVLFQF